MAVLDDKQHIEKESKFFLPKLTVVDLEDLGIGAAKAKKVTQIYMAPTQSTLTMQEHNGTLSISFNNGSEQNTIVQNDEQSLATYRVMKEAGLINSDNTVAFDVKDPEARLRITEGSSNKGTLTFKRSLKTQAVDPNAVIARKEFEFELPYDFIKDLLPKHIAPGTYPVQKTRFDLTPNLQPAEGAPSKMEFDIYHNPNYNEPNPLTLATISQELLDKSAIVMEIENPKQAPFAIMPDAAQKVLKEKSIKVNDNPAFKNQNIAKVEPETLLEHLSQKAGQISSLPGKIAKS